MSNNAGSRHWQWKQKFTHFLRKRRDIHRGDARGSRVGNNFNRRQKQRSRIGPKQRTTETTETDREAMILGKLDVTHYQLHTNVINYLLILEIDIQKLCKSWFYFFWLTLCFWRITTQHYLAQHRSMGGNFSGHGEG